MAPGNRASIGHREHLEHLVAVVVDDLHGNLAGCRPVKRAAGGRIEGGPRRLVDFRPQRPLQFVVRFLRAGEASVADEEALAIVVGVDEPAGDVVGRGVANLPGGRVVYVQALDDHAELAALTPCPSPGGRGLG